MCSMYLYLGAASRNGAVSRPGYTCLVTISTAQLGADAVLARQATSP